MSRKCSKFQAICKKTTDYGLAGTGILGTQYMQPLNYFCKSCGFTDHLYMLHETSSNDKKKPLNLMSVMKFRNGLLQILTCMYLFMWIFGQNIKKCKIQHFRLIINFCLIYKWSNSVSLTCTQIVTDQHFDVDYITWNGATCKQRLISVFEPISDLWCTSGCYSSMH